MFYFYALSFNTYTCKTKLKACSGISAEAGFFIISKLFLLISQVFTYKNYFNTRLGGIHNAAFTGCYDKVANAVGRSTIKAMPVVFTRRVKVGKALYVNWRCQITCARNSIFIAFYNFVDAGNYHNIFGAKHHCRHAVAGTITPSSVIALVLIK